jgi:2-oxoglutarate ferredoxin oxidoreductase subunit delta
MKYWRTPLDAERVTIPRGAVRVNRERCKGCGICIEFCPKQVLERSATFNAKGYHPPEVKAGAWCVNCHFCEVLCPDFAIHSTEITQPQAGATAQAAEEASGAGEPVGAAKGSKP